MGRELGQPEARRNAPCRAPLIHGKWIDEPCEMCGTTAPTEDWKLDVETVVAMVLPTTNHAKRVLDHLDECGWAVVRKDEVSWLI